MMYQFIRENKEEMQIFKDLLKNKYDEIYNCERLVEYRYNILNIYKIL